MTVLDRLPFVMPEFVRTAWVSPAAQVEWEPRIQLIARAWRELEVLAVLAGVREVALLRRSAEGLAVDAATWNRAGLSYRILGTEAAQQTYAARSARPKPGAPFVFAIAVSKGERTSEFFSRWTAADSVAMGEMLGYPACCTRAFRTFWETEGLCDNTWLAAGGPSASAPRVSIAADGPWEARTTWRWLGVRLVPHLPCRFSCEESIALGRKFEQLGTSLGFESEVRWIRELLTMPLRYSALHGVAEVRTPIVKFIANTDPTAREYVVEFTRSELPSQPAGQRTRGTRSYRDGLDREIVQLAAKPSWWYEDNGFQTLAAMRRSHAAIKRAAVEAVRAAEPGLRVVVDLGCGNGVLACEIAAATDLQPHGVELHPAKLARVAVVSPTHSPNFRCGDLFEVAPTLLDRDTLAVIAVQRLLENPQIPLPQILGKARSVLLYDHDGGLVEKTNVLGVEVTNVIEDRCGTLSL